LLLVQPPLEGSAEACEIGWVRSVSGRSQYFFRAILAIQRQTPFDHAGTARYGVDGANEGFAGRDDLNSPFYDRQRFAVSSDGERCPLIHFYSEKFNPLGECAAVWPRFSARHACCTAYTLTSYTGTTGVLPADAGTTSILPAEVAAAHAPLRSEHIRSAPL
jgi:hypothetical protein